MMQRTLTIALSIALFLLIVSPLLSAAEQADAVSGASAAEGRARQPVTGQTEIVQVGDARIHLFISDQAFELSHDELRTWVKHSAEVVANYYGGFPIDEVRVVVLGGRGTRVMSGRSIFISEAVINVRVGLQATKAALKDDWIMTHELIHLAFPTVPRRHHWVEEGLSTYVESIARAAVGDLDAQTVWTGFLEGMPKGLPREGDRGLDYTPTWGRTYWGGALFFLTADIRIRQTTDGARSLRDALRGIVAAGYNMKGTAEIRDVLRAGDAATGVDVLTELYDEMRASPVPEEIDSLWESLGVATRDGRIVFDGEAPLAVYREALTAISR